MEAIIFCGIQASGKSTFYKKYFFPTHVRISLDMFRTRHRENKFLETCINTLQPFVVDNTNPTRADRQKYIQIAKDNRFKVTGYYFQSKINESLARNNCRTGKEKIPEIALRGTYNKLELPSPDEGFDTLYYVELINHDFIIKQWSDEI